MSCSRGSRTSRSPPLRSRRCAALSDARHHLDAPRPLCGPSPEPPSRTPHSRGPIAQVHRARLHNGDEVVVKVQRENLIDLFKVDLWNIELVAALHLARRPLLSTY